MFNFNVYLLFRYSLSLLSFYRVCTCMHVHSSIHLYIFVTLSFIYTSYIYSIYMAPQRCFFVLVLFLCYFNWSPPWNDWLGTTLINNKTTSSKKWKNGKISKNISQSSKLNKYCKTVQDIRAYSTSSVFSTHQKI